MYANIYQYLASRVNLAFEEYAKTKHFSVGDDAKILAAAKKKDELIARLNYLKQAVKERFGKDLIITSAYRCPAHNARVGGVKGSYHTKGMAADVKVEGIDSVDLAIMAEQVGFTGFGIYNTFIHVDVREKPAKWYNRQPVDGKGESK